LEKVMGKLSGNSFILQQEHEMKAFENQVRDVMASFGK
jgi:hypothetical protein